VGVEAAALPSLSRRAAVTVARLASRGGTASVDVAGGRRVEVSYGRVRVEDRAAPRDRQSMTAATTAASVVIDSAGAYRWPAAGVVDVREAPASAGGPEGAAEFDADRIAWPLMLRGRRPGDRMRPRGGRGSRKLSDLMIDAKIARPARAALPVVTTADGVVLFVPGLRPAEAGRPGTTTRRKIQVCFERAAPNGGATRPDNK
jgi:tRNA(Ile)-lysidine synthetase-like protein